MRPSGPLPKSTPALPPAQRLAVYDRLAAKGRQLSHTNHSDISPALAALSARLANYHLSFVAEHTPAAESPTWHLQLCAMFDALMASDLVHVTADLMADHMPEKHFGVESCDDECEGRRLCRDYDVFTERFHSDLQTRVSDIFEHRVFGALHEL